MKGTHLLLSGIAASLITVNSVVWAESLEEVVAGVLSTHPQVLSAKSRWQAQQEAVNTAKSSYWPSLDVTTGIGKQKRDTSSTVEGQLRTRKEASISIRQNLFSGFNTFNSVRSAKQRTEAEQWRVQTAAEELGLQAIDAFLRVLERRDQVRLAEDNLELHDEIYQRIKRRTVQGVARNSDLTQIEGRRARANANLVSSRNNLLDAESQYLALVGSAPAQLDQPAFSSLVIPETLDAAIQIARKKHPGIKAANYDIASSHAQYQSVRSSFLPTLDLELDHSWRHNAEGIEGATNDFVAMVRVRYNLFRGGGDKARIRESAWRVEENRAQKDRTLRSTEERLRVAWAALELTGQQKEFLELHEKSSKETVAAYREQFNIGKRTLLDLLDGENELFQSSQSLTSAMYQEIFARYRILEATGQLLQALNISQPANDTSK